MPTIELSAALSANERTRPLLEGRVVPEGLKLVTSALSPGEMFWRQLKFSDFDVSEMSVASFMISTSQGAREWLGIPVFTTREFFHAGILVRKDAGIARPEELRGKRVGVLEYQQTAVVWIRGILKDEFGVEARDMEWFMQRPLAQSHGGSTGFKPPEGVRFQHVAPGKTMGEMLLAGELDALLFYPNFGDLVDRKSVDVSSGAATLFPDPVAEGHRYYAKTGIYPINHCVVVRRSIAERYPWVVLNLFKAFSEAKDQDAARRTASLHPLLATGLLPATQRTAVAADPLPYGVKSSRPALEAIARYLEDQGLTARRVALDEVFAAQTLDL